MSSNYGVPQKRASRQVALPQVPTTDAQIYNTRPPTSVRRYPRTDETEIIERGNQRLVIHREPPARGGLLSGGRGVFVGIVATFALLWLGSMGLNWWNGWQTDQKYGNPRTYQADAVVGHNDSAANPTHFIFLNLRGHVRIIEIPGGDASKAKIYTGPTLVGDNGNMPVTGEIKDETGQNTKDMVVHVGGQDIIYLNTGEEFKQQ
jgi:hypothetical protein